MSENTEKYIQIKLEWDAPVQKYEFPRKNYIDKNVATNLVIENGGYISIEVGEKKYPLDFNNINNIYFGKFGGGKLSFGLKEKNADNEVYLTSNGENVLKSYGLEEFKITGIQKNDLVPLLKAMFWAFAENGIDFGVL